MTDARVHGPVQDDWATSVPLLAGGPVWPCAGGMVLRSDYSCGTSPRRRIDLAVGNHSKLVVDAWDCGAAHRIVADVGLSSVRIEHPPDE
jgi:hypothetical protein